jgi:hypothetical protein
MATRRQQLIEDITDTRLSMDQHLYRLQELFESEEWDLAVCVLGKLRESFRLLTIATNDLAELEDK